MSYKLEYPYTEKERLDFIVQYNHNLGLRIETVDNFVEEATEVVNYPTYFALEAFEKLVEDEVIDNTEEYEVEQELKERERIAKLKLTKREVFLGLYQAKGVTPDMIKAQITDAQALIEFEYANDYYRGNPLIDIVGATLGITPEQLDAFFETNDYTCLLPDPIEETEEPVVEPVEGENVTHNDPKEEIIEDSDVDNSEGVNEENQVITETEANEV